jgi:hypothetical protein
LPWGLKATLRNNDTPADGTPDAANAGALVPSARFLTKMAGTKMAGRCKAARCFPSVLTASRNIGDNCHELTKKGKNGHGVTKLPGCGAATSGFAPTHSPIAFTSHTWIVPFEPPAKSFLPSAENFTP